jgi:hypothetical protein
MDRTRVAALFFLSVLLAGCASVELPAWSPESAGAAARPASRVRSVLPADTLPPATSWTEYRLRAADRINRANPDRLFSGALPAVQQAIPVLRILLTADGDVRDVEVVRQPGQSPETVQIAIDAIHRAAPYGVTRQLTGPAEFTETFLFNQELKFRLRSTVEGR